MKSHFLLCHACILLCLGIAIQALTYDYSATSECLEEAWEAQYSGGIIQNPTFDDGIHGWTTFGQGQIEGRTTKSGNKFIVSLNRTQSCDSFSQKIELEKGKIYAFSAWIQISQGSEIVSVIFRGPNGEKLHGGTVIAEQGCWSMLKGGIVPTFSALFDLTFQSQTAPVEIWADNVSLQPFTKKQWRSHQDITISKVRKRKLKFQITNANKTALNGAKITVKQTKAGFPIGCEINQNILTSTPYQTWFTSRFTVTAFGNEMKWYFTEKIQGQENYTIPDAMLEFCEINNISVRGHNILWDDPRYQPTWVNMIHDPNELKSAVEKRTKSVVSRYQGKLIAWDVVNENLHFRFYENILGENASAEVYAMTYELDQTPVLFMNEYNTIENSEDEYSIPSKYIRKLQNILSYNENQVLVLPMGVGVQSRFTPGEPNLAYMRAGMDLLGSIGYPIWLTEMFVDKGDDQEMYLEEVLREGYAHPGVEGIVIWPTSPFGADCKMCLVDQEFNNTPNGDVVDKFIHELWSSSSNTVSNEEGLSQVVLMIHGEYDVTIKDPYDKFSVNLKFKVTENLVDTIHVQL